MSTTRKAATVLLLAALLLLSACSDAGADDAPNNSAGGASAAPTSAAVSTPSASPSASATSSAPPTSTSAPTTSPADEPACTTDHLDVAVAPAEGGGAAGSVYEAITFTNTGAASCTLEGYPGVSAVAGDDGEQVGAAAVRDKSATATSVEVAAAGGEAYALLQVSEAGNYDADECEPTTARGFRVYPPGETAAAFAAADVEACASDDVTLLTVGPVQAGTPGG